MVGQSKVLLENGWNSKQMITEGEAAIPLETTLHAFHNQEKTKQRSTIVKAHSFFQALFTTAILSLFYGDSITFSVHQSTIRLTSMFFLLIVQAICGMCFGLIISMMCATRNHAIQFGMAMVLPTVIVSSVTRLERLQYVAVSLCLDFQLMNL